MLKHSLGAKILRELFKNGVMQGGLITSKLRSPQGTVFGALSRLIAHGYVRKIVVDNTRTAYEITRMGKQSFKEYIEEIQ